MLNYMKSELYRIAHGSTVYVFVGGLCVLGLVMNLLTRAAGFSNPDYSLATVWGSMSSLISSFPWLFFGAVLFAYALFADDRRYGTFKNALVGGCSRVELFAGRCLVSAGLGLAGMAAILVVYVGSAVLLLRGPALEPVVWLVEGVAAALPFTAACGVLGITACTVLPRSDTWSLDAGSVLCGVVVLIVPMLLSLAGHASEPVAALASWFPTNFFVSDLPIDQPALADFVWGTPAGLAKCLITGFAGLALFAGIGLWRIRKIEL